MWASNPVIGPACATCTWPSHGVLPVWVCVVFACALMGERQREKERERERERERESERARERARERDKEREKAFVCAR